ncbi:hypothetical protein [Estrella lausannensis]|nr:hypothetical protein [Estrella lausannensis]
MRKILLFLTLATSSLTADDLLIQIHQETADFIGHKIWKNECGGKVEGLTSWNKGETFASLGIGHFIWHTQGKSERFEETFPLLVKYLETEKVTLPLWLNSSLPCPWNSRLEFYDDIDSDRMKELRTLLLETKQYQAIFIATRFQAHLREIADSVSPEQQDKVRKTLTELIKTKEGLYSLIDYFNFKGSGLSPDERYNGRGWGLLQVILNMDISEPDLLGEFVKSAKATLRARVENSPPERNENKWLKGWFNRLDTYLKS